MGHTRGEKERNKKDSQLYLSSCPKKQFVNRAGGSARTMFGGGIFFLEGGEGGGVKSSRVISNVGGVEPVFRAMCGGRNRRVEMGG